VDGIHNGIHIPGYRMVRLLGEGGTARVFLAVQESLERAVAIKVLNPALTGDPEYSGRFLDEGRIIAALNHRNIVTIHDVGITGGVHYISMEYLEGGTLKERLDAPLPQAEAISLLRQLGGALAVAHRQGVVHRDVKPSNIMFRTDGTPLLTDFGIAKRRASDETLAGTVFGTPGYLSPEQAHGKPADGRSDIYSLGVVLYEMLVGERLFTATDALSMVVTQVRAQAPRLPPSCARFQPLLDRMLAVDPAKRFASVDAVLHALEAVPDRPRRIAPGLLWAGVAAVAALSVLAVLVAVRYTTVPVVPAPAITKAARTPYKDPELTVAGDVDPHVAQKVATSGTPAAAASEGGAGGPTPIPSQSIVADAPRPETEAPPKAGQETAPQVVERARSALSAAAPGEALSIAMDGLRQWPQDTELRGVLDGASAQLELLERVLERAERALTDARLTTPPGDNALAHFDEALSIEARDPRALAGRERIARRYAELARARIERYRYDQATVLIRRGLAVQPGNRELEGLLARARLRNVPRQLIEDVTGLFD
jgi:serine/threonine-protein kinase PpkA